MLGGGFSPGGTDAPRIRRILMSARLEDLVPGLQAKARTLVDSAARAGHRVVIVHTLRTWAEQERFYAKGRTIPGEPCFHNHKARMVGTCEDHPYGTTVTNKHGGFSWHNFGQAFDVAMVDQFGRPTWDPSLNWAAIGTIGENLGLEWGGRWRMADLGHFQERFGFTLLQMRESYLAVHPEIADVYPA